MRFFLAYELSLPIITLCVVLFNPNDTNSFHIIKEYCNKGFATEAALACKEYAFKVLHYHEVFSYTTERNIPSQKVAVKIGMQVYKYFEKYGEKQIVQVASKN